MVQWKFRKGIDFNLLDWIQPDLQMDRYGYVFLTYLCHGSFAEFLIIYRIKGDAREYINS